MLIRHFFPALICTAIFLIVTPATARVPATQQPAACQSAIVIPTTNEINIFTPEQEVELGDVLARFLGPMMQPIDDDNLTAHLRAVGERLVAELPPMGLKFRFYLVDLAQANAFSYPGGRVYVTRKLVSFLKSDDELAAVLGHELGHIVTHQKAIDFSGYFRQVGIYEVADERDIFAKFNRFLDSRSKVKFKAGQADTEQLGADRVGIELVVGGGYDIQSFPPFLDRLLENKGQTGSWWSDFMQRTPPNAKRYRELLKDVKALPAGCAKPKPAQYGGDFARWRAAVLRMNSPLRKENVHDVIWRKPLDPPLVEDFHQLKFSADGKYVLAQDSNSVFILTRQPFEFVFRIDAAAALPAQFTPDSTGVVIYNRELRVERWDLASKERVQADEVVIQKGCVNTRLSPDGRALACITRGHDLLVVDVATGDPILERPQFYKPKMESATKIGAVRLTVLFSYLNFEFSPDGKYFVASATNGNSLAFELATKLEVVLNSDAKQAVANPFRFLGPDRIASIAVQHGQRSFIAKFPSGERVQQVDFGSASVSPVTQGNYVLLRPIKDYAVGVLDLASDQVIRASKDPALDVYDKNSLSQLKSGEIGLFEASATPVATVSLPQGPLGHLQTASVSDDLSWLAVSFRRHGAVWNLKTGQMAFNLRGFNAVWFGDEGNMFAEFPKDEKSGHSIAHVGLASHTFTDAHQLEWHTSHQIGRYVESLHPPGKPEETEDTAAREASTGTYWGLNSPFLDILRPPSHNEVLDVSDARTGALLWSLSFAKEVPRIYWSVTNDRVAFVWHANWAGARAEWQRTLDANVMPLSKSETNVIVEVLQLSTGKILGAFEVDTHERAFLVVDVYAAGDYALVSDTYGRKTMYFIKDGKMAGRLVGPVVAFSATPQPLVVIEPSPGRLQFFDPASMTPKDEMVFSRGLSFVRLTDDGKKLFVVKIDQVAYLIDVSKLTAPQNPESKASAAAGNLR